MIRVLVAALPVALAAGGLAWAGTDLLSQGTLTHALADGNIRSFDAAADQFRRHRPGAESALATQHGDAQLRSRAQTLLGVLAVRDAALHPSQARASLTAAMTAFRDALVLDPGNEAAAANLELLYVRRPPQHGVGGRARGGRKPPGASGFVPHGSASPPPRGGGY